MQLPTPSIATAEVQSTAAAPKLFIRSFGCQMNVYDAQRMTDLLGQRGYVETGTPDDADVVVLNTCHIRERATEKIFSELGKIRALKKERSLAGRMTTVVVAGCVAQAEGGEILRREKAVDVVVGPQAYHTLPELIRDARSRPVATDFAIDDKFALLPQPTRRQVRARGPSAFLTIQEGCDKFCTFCVVPYTRGAEVSRPVAAVVDEARHLVDAGVREITLLGQNVNGYHGLDAVGRPARLADLCAALSDIPGLLRLRYTTSHPNDLDGELVAAHRTLPKLMPFLHLPVQSGSDRILAAMNRRHTTARYLEHVTALRAARSDLALSSDFIVGFPGETDGDFQATLDLIQAVGFASSFSFKYSPRPGTPGANMPDQVTEAIKSERLIRLQALLEHQRQAFNASTVGQIVGVLVERRGRHPGQVTGKSPYLQQVQLDAAESAIGSVVPTLITARAPNSLFGAFVGGDGAAAMDVSSDTVSV